MSETNRRGLLALEAFTELEMEMKTSPNSQAVLVAPSLSGVLSDIEPLPREALFLGLASDGLPVLLNLHDPLPGPLLVTADAGAGKTAFLRSVANSITQTHHADDVQYGVVTRYPEEWKNIGVSVHCVGVFPSYQSNTQDFILSLASWAHANMHTRQSVLLLIDDLEELARLDFETVQNLRWLLLRGPSRRVWPMVTVNAGRYGQVISWIPAFRTRIFGQIKDERIAGALGGDQVSALDTLEARIQFSLRENEKWLRFWLPSF